MWPSIILTFALLPFFSNGQEGEEEGLFRNPIFDGNSADPSIMKLDGFYYLTLSTEGETQISLFKNDILTSFRREDGAEEKIIFKPHPQSYRDVWASEMHLVNGELFVYFCMYGQVENHIFMYAIKADDPTNPMGSWSSQIRILQDDPNFPVGHTDGTVMKHGVDGSNLYFVWGSTGGLWIAPMLNATSIGQSKLFLRPPVRETEESGGQSWECSLDAVSGSRQCICEGPYFIYSQGVSYLVFSAGSTFGPDYVMGLMSIDAEKDPMIPSNWWFGDNGPVFWRNDEEEVYTTGHSTFTWSPDDSEMWIVYHASNSYPNPNGNRVARINKMDFDSNGKPLFPRPTGFNHSIPVPSGQLSPIITISNN